MHSSYAIDWSCRVWDQSLETSSLILKSSNRTSSDSNVFYSVSKLISEFKQGRVKTAAADLQRATDHSLRIAGLYRITWKSMYFPLKYGTWWTLYRAETNESQKNVLFPKRIRRIRMRTNILLISQLFFGINLTKPIK